jgi:hypothetical protein
MTKYDPESSMSVQSTAPEILKIMYNPPETKEAFYMGGPIPDDLILPEHWTGIVLMNALRRDRLVSSTVMRDTLEMLHAEGFIMVVPGVLDAFVLTPSGRVEAERLGVTSSSAE